MGKNGENGEKWNEGINLEYSYDIFNKDIIFFINIMNIQLNFIFS